MSTPKVLTVTLEFEMGERKIHTPRVKAAYEAAVSAAIEAAKNELLPGSVAAVNSRMTWAYRWADTSAQYKDVDAEWENTEEAPEP
ncbi:hypothetical protein ACQEU8_32900 [Streptomyces sp. CA-250714]|uniref:hypothetical protein n=1 Tax=Streptomyces sp. CA-250714 TaxID=3240060 RepID=UPI003D90BE5C